MASVLIFVPPLFAGIACGVLAYAGMSALVDLARVLRRRFSFVERLRRVFPEETRLDTGQRRWTLPVPVLIGLVAGLALAIVWRQPILSVWWIVLGGAFGWMMVSTRTVPRQALHVVEIFVSGLRNIYPVTQSVSGALEATAAHLSEDNAGRELKAAVAEVLRRLYSGINLKDGLAVLRESGWPMMARLSAVLEQVEHADENSVLRALETLEEQIRAARMLLDRASTVLVLNRLTLRALQIANLAGILMVSAIPTWHKFYADRPLGLVAATTMALAGSWYFSSEIRRMEAMLL